MVDCGQVTVGSPTASVVIDGCSVSDRNPAEGEDTTVTVTVRNDGDVEAEAAVAVYIGQAPGEETIRGGLEGATLGPGETTDVDFTFNNEGINAAPGEWHVTATIGEVTAMTQAGAIVHEDSEGYVSVESRPEDRGGGSW